MPFALGQRWLSDSETDLGVGTVIAVDARSVTLMFPGSEAERVYARKEAPLTRLLFQQGDQVKAAEGWQMIVDEVSEENGLLFYHGTREDTGEATTLRETLLDHQLQLNRPEARLFAGQVERMDRFLLRYQTRQQQARLAKSQWRGLLGARIQRIPHQLHIAREAAKRFAPRLLLSDEVGLGKTIEAGLIVHQQLRTGHAERILVVVPEPLLHQWLVELLRRFNLRFSLFDKERCQMEYEDGSNPFQQEQLVLCPQSLIESKQWRDLALEAGWDTLVVDEAHHLTWNDGQPSRSYRAVAELAAEVPSVLLLTATPDQLGHESHFARLRLLDPDRFHDYEAFLAEEQNYRAIADLAQPLIDDQPLTDAHIQGLCDSLNERDIVPYIRIIQDRDGDEEQRQQARIELLSQLLDRHGTSRVMFRNSRAHIKGFPARQLHAEAIPYPEQYQTAHRIHDRLSPNQDMEQRITDALYPEWVFQQLEGEGDSWTRFDPRIDWLIDFLDQHKQDKVLMICHRLSTVEAVAEAIRTRTGIRATQFHERMSLVERDRAAAYFGDEEGAQLLVCSEIGSEGRNFQFAHHLVMFDLPLNPDLLEQRIGRLDRIGQQQDVDIHVPYFEQTAQHRLLEWYHEGLNAFARPLNFGDTVMAQMRDDLLPQLWSYQEQDWLRLLKDTRTLTQQLRQQLEQGRDRLLELHSSGFGKAEALTSKIAEIDNDTALTQYMLALWDVFGVHQDDKLGGMLALKPGSNMLNDALPGLDEEGLTVTFEREVALAREDVDFITWDHPMVEAGIDSMISTDTGSSSVAILPNRALPAGSYFLEMIFVAQTTAPKSLQLGRFLSPEPHRLLLDANGNELSARVPFETLQEQLKPIGRHTGSQLVSALHTDVHPLVQTGRKIAAERLQPLIEDAKAAMTEQLNQEIDRLQALQSVNPLIRNEEIDHFRDQRTDCQQYLDNANVILDSIRLIVVTHDEK